jgi:anti-sigma regulatory factor (Ser/Thr protein kinase)
MTARLAMGGGAVARAIAFARRFAEAGGFSADSADRLAVVVEEWAANIVEHSGAAAGSLIVLRLERAGQGARATFTDAGMAFDPRSVKDDGPNLERGGGAGIALIRSWCEIEAYRRRAGRNRLVLRSRS